MKKFGNKVVLQFVITRLATEDKKCLILNPTALNNNCRLFNIKMKETFLCFEFCCEISVQVQQSSPSHNKKKTKGSHKKTHKILNIV